MASDLTSCFGSSEQSHQYTIQAHILGIWDNVGNCQFLQSDSSTIEVQGEASVMDKHFDFTIVVTNAQEPYLTVNGNPDTCATINGCTLQACDTLGGNKFSFSPDGQDTKVDTPSPYPDIKIKY